MVGRDVSSFSKDDGSFELIEVTGFCYDPEIKITFDGYKPFQIRFASIGDYNTYKVKSNPKSVEFDNPVYPDPKNEDTFVTGTWIEQNSLDFDVRSDSIIVYLKKNNPTQEIEELKQKLINGS